MICIWWPMYNIPNWKFGMLQYIKVKDRPFAEGSRGCHVLICLYAQPLSAREHHVIFPLMIATFITQYVAFILCHHEFIQRSIFSYTKWSNTFRSNFYCLIAPMTTYLKDLAQSLGRYGGLLKIRFGFLDAQVASLLGAEFLASKDGGQAPHVEGSMTI